MHEQDLAYDRDGASLILWVFHDIIERRRSELELVQAIDEVMKNARWLSRSIVDKLASLRRPGISGSNADLSPREREMLELICDDLDDPAIAARLGLSRNAHSEDQSVQLSRTSMKECLQSPKLALRCLRSELQMVEIV